MLDVKSVFDKMAPHKRSANNWQGIKQMASKTPAESKGIIVNVTKLKLKQNNENEFGASDLARTWVLSHDDDTHAPYFASVDGVETDRIFHINQLEKVLDVPAMPAAPVVAPSPVAVEQAVEPEYTDLQKQAIDVFSKMYDDAVKARDGQNTALNTGYGICDNIERYADSVGVSSGYMSEVKENLIRRTPSFSGVYHYPVPSASDLTPNRSFDRADNKWSGPYGENRLIQLGQLIECIKTQWDDSLIRRKSPAFRSNLKVGDIVRYTRQDQNSFWVLRRDDDSMSPSFHKLGEPENYTDIDLSYVEKVDNSTFDKKPIEEFLSDIDKKLAEKVEIEQQIEKLKAQLAAATASVAMLDCAMALQYKVKRL